MIGATEPETYTGTLHSLFRHRSLRTNRDVFIVTFHDGAGFVRAIKPYETLLTATELVIPRDVLWDESTTRSS